MVSLEGQGQSYAEDKPERRDHSRYTVDEDAVLLFAGQSKLQAGRIVNVGQEGCLVRTADRLTVRSGWPLDISFTLHGVAFRFSGVLRWANGGNLLGIRFVNVDSARMLELANVIAAMEAAATRAESVSRILVGQAGSSGFEQAGELSSDGMSGSESAWAAREERTAPATEGKAAGKAEVPTAQAPARRDRRASARQGVDSTASILLVKIGSTLRGRILDLSPGGCRIRTDERFPVGIYTRIETEFHLEGLPFRLGGVIQAIHDRNTVGIRFLDLSERKRQQVLELIGEIEALRAAQPPAGALVAESQV